jgi:hypothetical protein
LVRPIKFLSKGFANRLPFLLLSQRVRREARPAGRQCPAVRAIGTWPRFAPCHHAHARMWPDTEIARATLNIC